MTQTQQSNQPNVNQDIYDGVIAASLDTLRLSASEQYWVVLQLDQLKKTVAGELSDGLIEAGTNAQRGTIVKTIAAEVQNTFVTISERTNATTETIGDIVLKSTQDVIENAIEVAEPDTATADLLGALDQTLIQGLPLSDWWKQQAGDMTFKVVQQIQQGIANGETQAQITARIVGNSTESGVIDIAKQAAQTLVHTSIQAGQNKGRNAAFQNNSNVIQGIMQVSTLDSHTSDVCIAYSGATWDLEYKPTGDNDLPYNTGVPRHFNCRSVEVPVTKTFKQLGLDIPEQTLTTRASADGQIKANTSFDSFLQRMGTDFQDKTLGVGRADLWRDGKITLRDLVNGQGSPLTLDELRAKFGM